MKLISINKILDFLGPAVVQVYGTIANQSIKHLKPPDAVDEYTLDWIDSRRSNKQEIAEHSKAKVIIIDSDVKYTKKIQSQDKLLIVVGDPKLCLVKIGLFFFVERPAPSIHPTAIINPLASIGKNFHVGSNTTIGKCVIGNNVTVYANVVINDDVIIGDDVVIKPGAILGYDGFGYERDEANNWIKFPQLGRLIIHDGVEIGSHTCIDKGSLSDTVIGFNTKINNLCHIAHNVVIGKNVIITAHVNISGSTTIENDVWIGPNASLRGHQRIGEKTKIGTGAVVTKDIPANEVWVGNPASELKK